MATRRPHGDGVRPVDVAPGHLLVTPMGGGMSEAGVVSNVATGEHGLALHLSADVIRPERWESEQVWVSMRTAESLVVFPALAEHREGHLELSGIATPLEESRRRCVRGRTRVAVTFLRSGVADEPVDGHTLDLSRVACRVQVPTVASLVPGAAGRLVLRLDDGPVTVPCHITTADVTAGQAVLAFRSVPADDLTRIDRHVMSCVFGEVPADQRGESSSGLRRS